MARPRRALRVALYALGVCTVVSVCGAHMPREHIAMQTIELPVPPAEVYAVVRDVEATPAWRTGVTRVEFLPDRGERKVYQEVGDDGTITFEIAEDRPNERFVTAITDIDLAFTGRWVFQFQPTETGGTRLTVAEIGDVTNPLLRFLATTTVGFEGEIDQYLTDLRTHLGKRGA